MEKNRMIEDNHVQALMDFGLSFLQAKIYLNLVKLEKASVKSIAQTSKVARQDIYRLMPILMKVGLAEKIIGRPTIYKATPMKLGLSILFQKKKQECAELGNKEKWLLNNFPLCSSQNGLEEDNYNFRIICESTLLLKLIRKLIQKTHETIDVIIPSITKPWKLGEGWSHLDVLNVKKRSVKMRCISDKPNEIVFKQQTLAENTSQEYRCLPIIPFGMHISDKKEVALSISQDSGLPCFWSNNPNVVILAQNYFEQMWKKASKI